MLAIYVSLKKEQWNYILLIHVCMPITHQSKKQQSILLSLLCLVDQLPNLPINIEMQSASIEEQMVDPDHGENVKEHISTLQQVAKNIKVAQIKCKSSMTNTCQGI